MMTWVQTQKLRRDEASLMTEWQTRWAQSACFNADGVVDYERWSALPDRKHIVVLLKETNGLHGSLVEFLYHGGSKTYYRTWNNVARWANMILNGTYWKFVPKSSLDDMVRNIAVVNLKKCPGGAIASSKAVRQAARQDADLLKCQIQLYEPDIILTGGWGLVSNILHDEIFADDAEWIRPHEETVLWYYKSSLVCPHEETVLWYYKSSLVCAGKETLVVSMPHPNRAAKNWTLELEKVLRATRRL